MSGGWVGVSGGCVRQMDKWVVGGWVVLFM